MTAYGFNFNGHHCSEFGIAMRSKNRQLLPSPNDCYVQVPGRQGAIHFPRELNDRHIELDCTYMEKNLPGLRIRAREIASWLHTENREILSFDDEAGRYYRGKLANRVDFEHLSAAGQFSLIFRCEPLAYGGVQVVDFISGAASINNIGTFKAMPIFTVVFTAAVTEWKVTGPEGQYIRIVYGFKADDVLEVNCATGAILINDTRALNKLDWQNSRFFCLQAGESALSVTPKCKVQVSWIPRYL